MWGLKKELETRKENLISLLKNKKDFLEIEKQHQIYGAIKELDHVVKLIEEQREVEYLARHDFATEELSSPIAQIQSTKGEQIAVQTAIGSGSTITAKKVDEKTKKFRIPFKIKFAKKNDA